MKGYQWIIFATLCVLATMSKDHTDFAVFTTGLLLLWALTEKPKKEDS